jgi:FkbM family methyltransferase
MPRQLIRKYGLRALRTLGREIRIRHHWIPGQTIVLHSFKHKGYWWHGRAREHDEMVAVAKLLREGDIVIEVGAHIGYLTTYFADIVGPNGKVVAFEPSDENESYLSRNVAGLPQVEVDRHGVADFQGKASFFVESLTGQNNSLYNDYVVFEQNAKNAGVAATHKTVSIEVTTIDLACKARNMSPDFIKIDIEGAELDALRGMPDTLASAHPIIFIEITKNTEECFAIFEAAGYAAFDASLRPAQAVIKDNSTLRSATGDFFFVHRSSDRMPVPDRSPD